MHRTAEGGVAEASKGAVGKEVTTIIKPGAEDKWVHNYREGSRWEPWQGVPFMRDGRIDLARLLRANEKGTVPSADGEHLIKDDTVQRGRPKAVGRQRGTGSLAWRGKHGSYVC